MRCEFNVLERERVNDKYHYHPTKTSKGEFMMKPESDMAVDRTVVGLPGRMRRFLKV